MEDLKKKKKLDIASGLKPVFVVWEDAMSIDEWSDSDELLIHECATIYSVGFQLEYDDKRMVLALNHDPSDGSSSCVMYIPRGMIKAVISLDT